MKENLKFFKKN